VPLNPRAYKICIMHNVPTNNCESKGLDDFVDDIRHENNLVKIRRRSIITWTRPSLFILSSCLHNFVPRTESFLSQHDQMVRLSRKRSTDIVQNLNAMESPSTDPICHYPWPAEAFTDLHSFYIYSPKCHLDLDSWQKLCPRPIERNVFFLRHFLFNDRQSQPNLTLSLDISRFWSLEDDPQQVASEMMRESLHFDGQGWHSFNETMEGLLSTSLAESLKAYKEFCRTHLLSFLPNHSDVRFKCRLVATSGPSGAKCPQYHIDHVPVRWIQTFFGPGVELIMGNEGVRWDALLNLDHELDNSSDDAAEKFGDTANIEQAISWTTVERNLQLVDANVATVYQAKEGEAVIMLGNQWNDVRDALEAREGTKTSKVKPVVHKSPELSTIQSRVLLTQDIIVSS
jgi:hypothetical protein